MLIVYPPDHGRATLNSPEHSSATAPSLGKPSNNLPVHGAFTFTRNSQLLLYMPRHWYRVNDHRKNFMIMYIL